MTVLYNSKGALVAIVTFAVYAVGAITFNNTDSSFIVSGLFGLLVSILLSFPFTGYFSLPHIMFIPTHVLSMGVIYIGIHAVLNPVPKYSAEELIWEEPHNPYIDSVETDLSHLLNNGQLVEYKTPCENNLQSALHNYIEGTSKLLIRTNLSAGKVLLLIHQPGITTWEKQKRQRWVDRLFYTIDSISCIHDKTLYAGIADNDSIYITRSVSGIHISSQYAGKTELSGFYQQEEASP